MLIENSAATESPLRGEVDELRRLLAERSKILESLVFQIATACMPGLETELTAESINAATAYVEKLYRGAGITERQLIVNANAHGFFTGWRAAEKSFKYMMTGNKNV